MYLLFRYKNVMPMEFYRMGRGEKIVARSFMKREVEEREKTRESISSLL